MGPLSLNVLHLCEIPMEVQVPSLLSDVSSLAGATRITFDMKVTVGVSAASASPSYLLY